MQIAQKNFYKKLFGKVGEKKAQGFLKDCGYVILEENYKTHIGEIDIIALDGETIVFCEVKTRTNNDYGEPSEAVNARKREKYFKVATEYLSRTKKMNSDCRFDVVEIENGKINHIKDAFSL